MSTAWSGPRRPTRGVDLRVTLTPDVGNGTWRVYSGCYDLCAPDATGGRARMRTMVATVMSLMQSKAKARQKLIASEPMRPRLLNAAAVGPVALDVIVSYESLGYGPG